MAIRTDFRITDDTGSVEDILVRAFKDDEGDEFVTIEQDGVTIELGRKMLKDVLDVLGKV